MIVECSDGVGKSTYSLNSLVNEGGFLKILIDRETDPDAVPDLRMQYITVEYAKSDYNGEIVVPTVNLPENEVNDGGEINRMADKKLMLRRIPDSPELLPRLRKRRGNCRPITRRVICGL